MLKPTCIQHLEYALATSTNVVKSTNTTHEIISFDKERNHQSEVNSRPWALPRSAWELEMERRVISCERMLGEIRTFRLYRLAAYRQFTYWVHNKLGRHVRQVIPSCAVNKIRETFPDATGQYRGCLEYDEQ